MRRKTAAVCLVVSAALVACASRTPPAPSPEAAIERPPAKPGTTAPRPHVILVTLDAFRADRLGALGYPRPTTPRLDALARDGILFEQAVANAGWTLPCVGSLLTGLTPPVHRVQDSNPRLSPAIRTLPALLREAGYGAPALQPWYKDRGFGFDPAGDPEAFLDYTSPAPRKYEKVLGWIAKHRETPFFLHVHDPDPHLPYEPSPESLRIFEPEPYAGPPVDATKATALALAAGKLVLEPRQIEHIVNLYDAGVREADENLGRFLDALGAEGILDDAIVVVTADHGEEVLDRGQLGHAWWTYRGNLHEETVRIPWIVWGARIEDERVSGVRIAEPVQQVDLMPTVLDLLGHPVPEGLDGMSLVPAIRAAAAGRPSPLPADRAIFAESSPAGFYAVPDVMGEIWLRSVRTPPWKLVVEQGIIETRHRLYDLANDPRETRDVASEHPAQMARLRALLDQWLLSSRRRSLELRRRDLQPEALPGIEGALTRP